VQQRYGGKITPQKLHLIDQIRQGLRAETLCQTRADTTNFDVDMARSDHMSSESMRCAAGMQLNIDHVRRADIGDTIPVHLFLAIWLRFG
jgi:hypothetical protein